MASVLAAKQWVGRRQGRCRWLAGSGQRKARVRRRGTGRNKERREGDGTGGGVGIECGHICMGCVFIELSTERIAD